jgi:tRNA pseudouridine55 synthase
MGQALGCGAHLESLCRTSVAEFTLAEAHTLEEIQGAQLKSQQPDDCHPDRSFAFPKGMGSGVEGTRALPEALFVHPRKLLPAFPSVTADEMATAHIRSGRPVNLAELSRARQIKVFSGQRDLIAIATRIAGTLFHPKIVLCAG